jgi:hypothetical protein
MGCEERHEPRERLPALLASLPSLLLPLGVCSRGGNGEVTLDLRRSSVGEDTMQKAGKRRRTGEERSGVKTAMIPLF